MIFIVAEAESASDTTMNPAKLAKVAHELGILTFTVLRNGSSTVQHDVPVGILLTMPHQTSMQDFNTKVQHTVRGIVEVVKKPGLVNMDLSDVGTLIGSNTRAMTGSGIAMGADRALSAATQAMENFSNCDTCISNASSLLINITSNNKLKLAELEIAMKIAQCAAKEASIIIGSVFDETMGDTVRITAVAMGI
jgi:cell division protein FtsZ